MASLLLQCFRIQCLSSSADSCWATSPNKCRDFQMMLSRRLQISACLPSSFLLIALSVWPKPDAPTIETIALPSQPGRFRPRCPNPDAPTISCFQNCGSSKAAGFGVLGGACCLHPTPSVQIVCRPVNYLLSLSKAAFSRLPLPCQQYIRIVQSCFCQLLNNAFFESKNDAVGHLSIPTCEGRIFPRPYLPKVDVSLTMVSARQKLMLVTVSNSYCGKLRLPRLHPPNAESPKTNPC